MKMLRMSVKSRIAAAVVAAALAGGATLATAGPAAADSGTPAQLINAGWTCIQPHLAPALLLCAPPRHRPAPAAGHARLRRPGTVV